MSATTSLKLPDALKAQIAQTAARQGKTAHGLMIEALQTAMDDARMRQQFYEDGVAAYKDMVNTNVCYDGEDVFAWMRAKVRGGNPAWPDPKPYRADKPIRAKTSVSGKAKPA